MAWYAFENIEEALQDSKDMLFPFDVSVWAKLGVIILLTGYVAFPSFGGTSVPSTDYSGPDSSMGDTGQIPETSINTLLEPQYGDGILEEDLVSVMPVEDRLDSGLLFFAFAGLFAGIVLLMFYVSSLFEFVLFQSLMEKDVKILSYSSENLWKGLQYFIYRMVFFLVIVLGVLSLLITPWSLLGLIPLVFVLLVLNWVVFHFALLNMLESDNNIVYAFRESLSILSGQLDQALLYLVVKWVLGLITSIVAGLLVVMVVLTMFIPLALLGLLLGLISVWLLIPLAVFSVTLLFGAMVIIAVPFRVYLYNYIIQVYGDFSQE